MFVARVVQQLPRQRGQTWMLDAQPKSETTAPISRLVITAAIPLPDTPDNDGVKQPPSRCLEARLEAGMFCLLRRSGTAFPAAPLGIQVSRRRFRLVHQAFEPNDLPSITGGGSHLHVGGTVAAVVDGQPEVQQVDFSGHGLRLLRQVVR